MGKGESKGKTVLRKIPGKDDTSHADIVEANPRADTVKLRTLTDGKPGTRTYDFSTTHGLSPERVTKESEIKEGRERGEAERHLHIRTKTRQGEITERY